MVIDNNLIVAAVGSGGAVAATFSAAFLTARHFRTKRSEDHKVDVEAETTRTLAEPALFKPLLDAIAAFGETLRIGVFEENARHAEEMKEERAQCDRRLSRMGERLDDVQAKRVHDMRNMLSVQLALAEGVAEPKKLAAMRAHSETLIRGMEEEGNAIAAAADDR